jgi:hypothetical protein
LNDDFTKLPQSLQDIINDEEKRKKLIVYINPPYAEATSTKTISNINSLHKENVGISKIKAKYEKELNQASKELYVQFLYRIYIEIPDGIIANFSKIKTLQGNHYKEFRNLFLAKLEELFIVPADTFDEIWIFIDGDDQAQVNFAKNYQEDQQKIDSSNSHKDQNGKESETKAKIKTDKITKIKKNI